ncbi:hypothetical protein EDC04DRAFT_2788353, partial [Pisolithus marmoratus]
MSVAIPSTRLFPSLVLLPSTFALAFYFLAIPIDSLKLPRFGLGVAMLASVLGGFGVMALFCSVGV